MTTIRPNVFPQAPQPAPRDDAGKQAAQRAFFAAALGRAQGAPVTPPIAPTPVEPVQPATAKANPPATPPEPPQRILRPGSIVDIRV